MTMGSATTLFFDESDEYRPRECGVQRRRLNGLLSEGLGLQHNDLPRLMGERRSSVCGLVKQSL